jgi:hypothetical protein
MTRRLFYITLGATVGVIVMRRLTAVAESLQPDNVARRLVVSAQEFVREVRTGMAEREGELRSALAVDESPKSA